MVKILVPHRPAPTPEDVGVVVADGVASKLFSVEDAEDAAQNAGYMLISPSNHAAEVEANPTAAGVRDNQAPASMQPPGSGSSNTSTPASLSAALPRAGGYLRKYGEKGLIKTWKQRWFELHPHRKLLTYYRSKPDGQGSSTAPLGQILINNAAISLSKTGGHDLVGDSGVFTLR